MKANELRIGNWVSDNDGCHGTLISIHEGDSYRVRMGNNVVPLAGNFLNPIPITAGRLRTLGFKKLNNAWVPLDYNPDHYFEWRFTIWNEVGSKYSYNSSEFKVPLKYIHQIQNLYFALIRKELVTHQTPDLL